MCTHICTNIYIHTKYISVSSFHSHLYIFKPLNKCSKTSARIQETKQNQIPLNVSLKNVIPVPAARVPWGAVAGDKAAKCLTFQPSRHCQLFINLINLLVIYVYVYTYITKLNICVY